MFACKVGNDCRPCGHECNKRTDTVKVDLDKENVLPVVKPNSLREGLSQMDRQRQVEEEKHRLGLQREQERLHFDRETLEAKQRLEKECEEEKGRLEVEQQRLEEQRQRMAEAAQQEQEAERRRQEELAKELEEVRRAKERERQEAEQRDREAELRSEQEEVARVSRRSHKIELQSKLRSVLASLGFKDVNEKKKVKTGLLSFGFTYPLHAAVRANNPEAIELLLSCGADSELTDSKKLTPLDLAKKLNKNESHKQETALLTTSE